MYNKIILVTEMLDKDQTFGNNFSTHTQNISNQISISRNMIHITQGR
jgi:hypothetical protein